MDAVWVQVLIVAVLVLINALLSGSEIALISLREGQLARLGERGRAGSALARLAPDPNRFMSTVQIGITLTGFLASATAAVTLAEPLVGPLAPLGAAARPTAVVLVVLALTFVALVAGELVPKRLAMQRAEAWGLLAACPLAVLAAVARPVIWVLGRITDAVVRALGGDPTLDRQAVTEQELRDMVAAQPDLDAHRRAVIEGAFAVADRTLRQILVARPDITALPDDADVSVAARRLVETRHSRAPVYAGDLDHVVGIAHLRDLYDATGQVGDVARPPVVLPETLGALGRRRGPRARWMTPRGGASECPPHPPRPPGPVASSGPTAGLLRALTACPRTLSSRPATPARPPRAGRSASRRCAARGPGGRC
ncbi:HlyC/CorC family transporter [Egibacter rhizosphaerae]|uniref:HlyC/CorC family transporter n=1 Tax=Egibacter rhizosphaerae TaxID=1670831 RepID=A0A411YFQ3_9ACTN|nr:hemolysin family protein [Egibacter rhizosphaerae]QBI20094.1 HlyC/CorC family transporter [Egibacter rhizosphaerae]